MVAKVSALTLYTCPTGKFCRVAAIQVANISAAATTVTLHHVRPKQTASASNALYYDMTVPKSTVVIDDSPKYMTEGDSLVVLCSTGAHATVTLYGMET